MNGCKLSQCLSSPCLPPFLITLLSAATTTAHHVGVVSSHSYTTPSLSPNPRPISSLATLSLITFLLPPPSTISPFPINIHNICIPSPCSFSSTYPPTFNRLFQARDDTFIPGDFNAHPSAWCSQTSDTRAAGREYLIHDTFIVSDQLLLNTNSLAQLPSNTYPIFPDLPISTLP